MRTFTFSTKLRFMHAGDFTLKAAEPLAVPVRDSFGDNFSPFLLVTRDVRRVRLEYPACALKIAPRPPPPDMPPNPPPIPPPPGPKLPDTPEEVLY